MDDAISRSDLRKELNKFKLCDVCMEHEWAIQGAEDVAKYTIEAIKNAPVLDAVPVVRCVDCKYRCTLVCPMYHVETCLDDLDRFYNYDVDRTDDDGFCHLGERWEGEEDDA